MSEINEYIATLRSQGFHDDAIYTELNKVGWDHDLISDAMKSLDPPSTPQKPQTPVSTEETNIQTEPQIFNPDQQMPPNQIPYNQSAEQQNISPQKPKSSIKQMLLGLGFIVLGLSAVLGGYLFFTGSSETTRQALLEKPPEGTKVLSTDEFDILIPDDWTLTEDGAPESGFKFWQLHDSALESYDPAKGGVMFIAVDTETPLNAVESVDRVIDNMTTNGEEFNIHDDQTFTIDGFEARRLEISTPSFDGSDSQTRGFTLAVRVHDKMHIINIGGPSVDWEATKEFFTLIVDSYTPNAGGLAPDDAATKEALEVARRDTNRKATVGRILANAERYASNNNGQYPSTSDQLIEMLADYFQDDLSALLDPTSSEQYKIVNNDPKLGEMQYALSAKCLGGQFIDFGGKRNIALRTYLEDNSFYCLDNN